MSLAGGNQVRQVLLEVFNFRGWLAADVWVRFGQRSIVCVASVRQNSWVGGCDDLVNMLQEFFL